MRDTTSRNLSPLAGPRSRKRTMGAIALLATLGAGACSHPMAADLAPPPAAEFGYGPRVSARGTYRARVAPLEPISVGRMHRWRLELEDAEGAPVTGASIAVDGGMPQHGHGLPTRPRVTAEPEAGAYRVEGMKFNMGGWWVVEFRVDAASGLDTVTFNLSL